MTKVFAILLLTSSVAGAADQHSWGYLTTGNGHGFQVFDTAQHKITAFLDHPYRYLGPRPDPKSDGYGRRNLAYDIYFGVKGGGSSGWLNAAQNGAASYVQESNLITVPATQGAVQAESTFFAPFGYEGNALIAVLKAPGATDGYALLNFHMGGGQPDSPDATGESLRYHTATKAVIETGPGGGAMVYVPLSGVDHADCVNVFTKVQLGQDLGDNQACAGNDVVPGFQKKLGADGQMAVAMVFVENAADADAAATSITAWANGRAPQKLLDDAIAEWEAWRKPPAANVPLCSQDEQKLWRQSETTLRMGQVREVNTATRHNNGMILASLPPGEWHSGWVRDATYATVALARSGHVAEAKASLNFFLNATPVSKYQSFVGNQPYKISVVRYFGSGEEEADYSGQQSPNIEIDGWGLFLWASRQYVEASGDTAWLTANYPTLVSGVGAPLEANVETNGIVKADSSIWEVHDQNKKHFAYTTITGARGFCDLAALAAKNANATDQAHYAQLAAKIRTAFLGAFVDSNGALGGSLEGIAANKYYDGAVAEAFTMNILPDFGGATAKATLDVFNHLRVDSGGFKRNNDGLSSYDNNEWILVDMRVADSLRRAGRGMEADGYLSAIISKAAANYYLLPELYNAVQADGQIGKYTGSIPMVGYGGGAYLITMIDRAGVIEPNDCGDGKGMTLPLFTCQGGTGPVPDGGTIGGDGDGGTGNGNGPGGKNIPYVPACYCNLGGGCTSAGTVAVLFLPALFIAWRLRRRTSERP